MTTVIVKNQYLPAGGLVVYIIWSQEANGHKPIGMSVMLSKSDGYHVDAVKTFRTADGNYHNEIKALVASGCHDECIENDQIESGSVVIGTSLTTAVRREIAAKTAELCDRLYSPKSPDEADTFLLGNDELTASVEAGIVASTDK